MKQITAEDVRKLREETGEGILACKKILLKRAAQDEKAEMLSLVSELTFTDRKTERLVKQIITYLIRKA